MAYESACQPKRPSEYRELPNTLHLDNQQKCGSKAFISISGCQSQHTGCPLIRDTNPTSTPFSIQASLYIESCCLHSMGLSCAGIQALCADTRLSLKWPDLSHNQLEAAAIAQHGAASWPCLHELTLSCTDLGHEAFQQLCLLGSSSSSSCSNSKSRCCCCCSMCWPKLTHLNF